MPRGVHRSVIGSGMSLGEREEKQELSHLSSAASALNQDGCKQDSPNPLEYG